MIRFKYDGHTFEGEYEPGPDGNWVMNAASVCGPHDDQGNHPVVKHPVCDGFAWIGQSFKHCDDCGNPYWEHTHDKRSGAKWGEVRLVPITPEQAAACKAKWDD